jgi:mono/diheme cytochrome c family protein
VSASMRAQRALVVVAALGLSACSWFTDFKQQPKFDPWDSPSDTIPPRANPQGSVPISGSVAPEFAFGRTHLPADIEGMGAIPNPTPADSVSVVRGQQLFQINCAVCHGATGSGIGALSKYSPTEGLLVAAPLGAGSAAAGYADGKIFAIIRNGRGRMPSYARIEESERWDIVNYIRALQGKGVMAADTSIGRPGETGRLVPGASRTAPTRAAPYFRNVPTAAPPATKAAVPPPTHPDTTMGARS